MKKRLKSFLALTISILAISGSIAIVATPAAAMPMGTGSGGSGGSGGKGGGIR